jgi:hypothetical protein
MKAWIVLAVALAACGKKDEGQDPKKLPPLEACRVVAKRVFECRDVIVEGVIAEMKKQGEDGDVDEIRDVFAQPMPCEGADPKELDPLLTCYDHDCKKLAACVVPILAGGMEAAPTPVMPE